MSEIKADQKSWCHEPVWESGLDIDSNPRLLLLACREAREADCPLFDDVISGLTITGGVGWM